MSDQRLRPMARLLRIACFIAAPIAAGATIGVVPASAQFFNPFEALFGAPPRPWWKPHRPNLTGTPAAHRPIGSTLAQGRRPKATGDYKAWTPGS